MERKTKLVGDLIFKIGDSVSVVTYVNIWGVAVHLEKGEIVDVKIQKKGAVRIIKYLVRFPGMDTSRYRKTEYWIKERNLEMWSVSHSINRFLSKRLG